jgi:hypothetical protein
MYGTRGATCMNWCLVVGTKVGLRGTAANSGVVSLVTSDLNLDIWLLSVDKIAPKTFRYSQSCCYTMTSI